MKHPILFASRVDYFSHKQDSAGLLMLDEEDKRPVSFECKFMSYTFCAHNHGSRCGGLAAFLVHFNHSLVNDLANIELLATGHAGKISWRQIKSIGHAHL